MLTNNMPQPRRLGSRGTNEDKSDIEVWANYLIVCIQHTAARTMIEAAEPALWQSVREMKDESVADLLALDALLATPDAATTMVRQIRDALFVEISQQCHERLDPRVRALIRTLHE